VPLDGKQRRALRALAHPLKPVLQVGHHGVTEGVIGAVDGELELRELLKVKVAKECPVRVPEAADALAAGTRSEIAQIIGRTVVLYRRRAKKPTIRLPKSDETAVLPTEEVWNKGVSWTPVAEE
jgi:RNA-binding protein